MPIDPDLALSADPLVFPFTWTQDDAILYALGCGVGVGGATEPRDLQYVYEVNQKVLPSFGVVPPFKAVWEMNAIDGLDINLMMVLHGEQELTVHREIPVEASTVNTARVTELQDKGKAAVVKIAVDTALSDGTPLFTNVFSIFARGEGGFGGDQGEGVTVEIPDRAPDAVTTSPTMSQQALIYRLSGDKNPLHADPMFARMAGFETPILHGLASYGVVCKAVVDSMLDGDPTRLTGYRTRFAGVVFPGETIVTEMWRTDAGIVVRATTEERGEAVLTNCLITATG